MYLRFLSEKQVAVAVKLRDGETVYGWIEYFDDRMIRLTREGKPNLFIYKHQIRTISENLRSIEARRKERNRNGAAAIPVLQAPQTETPENAVTLALVGASTASDGPFHDPGGDTGSVSGNGEGTTHE